MIIMIRKKGLVRLAGVAAAVVIAGSALFTGAKVAEDLAIDTSADGNWGLSFQQEGQAPVTNVTAEFLSQYDGYYMGDSS